MTPNIGNLRTKIIPLVNISYYLVEKKYDKSLNSLVLLKWHLKTVSLNIVLNLG